MSNPYVNYKMGGCLLESAPSRAPELIVRVSGPLPQRVDLRPFCSPVEDQGRLNSCAGNAVVGALEYHQRKSSHPDKDLSRLFVYYNARKIGDTQNEDSGTYIHHVMASVLAFGVCPEHMWPYMEDRCLTRPEEVCYSNALEFAAVSYARTGNAQNARAAVAAGLPIVFGICLPSEMLQVEAAMSGEIKRPSTWPERPNFGHAMLIVGYDEAKQAWLVRNSWGPGFGRAGHCWIDYEVMSHYSHPHAFWTIGAIEASREFSLSGPRAHETVAATRSMAPDEMRFARTSTARASATSFSNDYDAARIPDTVGQGSTFTPQGSRQMAQDFMTYRRNGCLIEETPSAAPTLQLAAFGGLPERVDLRAMCSPVEDQGRVGSCAANAAVGALEYHLRLAREPLTDLSRLYVYFNARRMAGKQAEDCGTFISHVMASVMGFGACPEQMWPYVEAMWPSQPTDDCYRAGGSFTGVSYARVGRGPGMKVALASGLPVVFGIVLPDEMLMREGAQTGRIQRPRGQFPPHGSGGHAMLVVGYDDAQQAWLVRNSWGERYGEGGYVWIDYQVMDAYSHPHEFWTIGAIEGKPGLKMMGPSMQQAVQQVQQEAPAQVTNALARMRSVLGRDLNESLEEKRQSLRDRLRGPGAGGGY